MSQGNSLFNFAKKEMAQELHREYFNLEGGDRCFFFEDRFIISHRLKFKKDEFELDHQPGKDIRKKRLILNITLTIAYFIFIYWTGFYPLIIAFFLSVWDLNQIKRYTLPVSNSHCFLIEKIDHIKIRRGGLSFNYIDIFLKTDDGKMAIRPLKVYDSDEETAAAIEILTHLNLIDKKEIDKVNGIRPGGTAIELSPRSHAYFNKNGIYFTEDHQFFDKRTDYVYVKNMIFYGVITLFLFLVVVKSYWMFTQHDTRATAFVLLSILIAGTLLPFKFLNYSNINFIPTANFIDFKSIKNGKGFIVYFKDSNGKRLKRKLLPYEPYMSFEQAEKELTKFKSLT